MGLCLVPWPHSCIHSQRGHSEEPGQVAGSAHPGRVTQEAAHCVGKPITCHPASPEKSHRPSGPEASLPPPQIVWPPHE